MYGAPIKLALEKGINLLSALEFGCFYPRSKPHRCFTHIHTYTHAHLIAMHMCRYMKYTGCYGAALAASADEAHFPQFATCIEWEY